MYFFVYKLKLNLSLEKYRRKKVEMCKYYLA